jgi:hypothetical protein
MGLHGLLQGLYYLFTFNNNNNFSVSLHLFHVTRFGHVKYFDLAHLFMVALKTL